MNIFKSLDQISFGQLIGLSFIIIVVLAVPVTVWVSQQQTQLAGRAYFEKPEVIRPTTKYGQPPTGQPQIRLVWPFLGKVGDAVLIEGDNFGNNPRNKQLIVGGAIVPEENIQKWTPSLIEFLVPAGASSGYLRLQAGGRTADWPYLFTVYSTKTSVQVTENQDILRVLNPPPRARLTVFFSNQDQLETDQLDRVELPSDQTVISVSLKDENGQPIPFFVEPEEFGF